MKERNPSKKKQVDYQKQYFNLCEYPTGFSKRWKKKKRLVQKSFRNKSKQNLYKFLIDERNDSNNNFKRKPVRKWGIENLQSKVKNSLKSRIQRFAWNFFKESYNTKKHRDRFTEILHTIIEGNGDYSKEYALLFKSILLNKQTNIRIHFRKSRKDWLNKYLNDCPKMKEKLKKWIEKFDD